MADWQITAKTIYCEAVDDEVTLLVHKDASCRCTGCRKYSRPNPVTLKIIRQKDKLRKNPLKCEGEQCPRLTQYKAKIMAEETQQHA